MKSPVLTLLAFCLVATVLSVAAAPLKRADVPANPVWLFHIDCDALRQTYLGRYLLYQVSKPAMHSNLVAFESLFSFDYRTQLHGVTVYTERPFRTNDMAIIYADIVPDHMAGRLKDSQRAEATTAGQHTVYRWRDQSNPNTTDYAVIQRNCVITAQDTASMAAALAAMDGTAPNFLASKALRELPAAGDATFLQATARNFDFVGAEPHAALLKLAKWAALRANETNERLDAVLTIELGDEYTATEMSLVARGLIAQLSLQTDNPKAAALASSISIKRSGNILTATLSAPSADLIAALKVYTAKRDKP
ncbi:MAG TPA: hypothetical protein VH595_15390 [Verrucomicrobiae bacterium]|jgi:hypothetical protein|nr:hypothetical protein [Verrucomicrobiae bacterium]